MFDAIIGHPQTYQQRTYRSSTQFVASALPLYHLFVNQAKKLAPHYISMIIPAKWLSDEAIGLKSFKQSMFNDGKLKKLFDYENAISFFPTIKSGGGFCFFLWDREYQGECKISYTPTKGEQIQQLCALHTQHTYIRDLRCLSIIEKIRKATPENHFMHTMVSSRKPFGLETFIRPHQQGELSLRHKDGSGPFPKDLITKNIEWISKWKVMTTYLGDSSNHFPRKIFLTLEVLPPNHICTETYLIVGVFDTKQEAENLLSYLKTKFARFLISCLATTQHLCKDKFRLMPIQDFSKPWNDKELFYKYHLSIEEINLIQTKIKSR